jgi:hypothetical protein
LSTFFLCFAPKNENIFSNEVCDQNNFSSFALCLFFVRRRSPVFLIGPRTGLFPVQQKVVGKKSKI